jgi:hypothetical protein
MDEDTKKREEKKAKLAQYLGDYVKQEYDNDEVEWGKEPSRDEFSAWIMDGMEAYESTEEEIIRISAEL